MKSFLIIQTAFIGDVVLATALIEKLHRHYPEAAIDFAVRKGNEGLLSGHPHLRKVWIWDKKQHKYRHLMALARNIRAMRYDWVINCQRFAASGFLATCSGARTAGFDKNPLSFLFTRRLAHHIGRAGEEGRHEVSRNLALIEHLTDNTFERPRLYPSDKDRALAQQWSDGRPYVCLAPTSVWHTKQFPAHKWVALIDRLPADHQVFLLGGPGDRDACARIQQACTHAGVQNLSGALGFLASAALMQGAAMNYVNDSAPLHFASAMNAPVTAVFCSTLPAFGFTPLSDQSTVIETLEPLRCRPCGLHGKSACPEGHFACAENIDVARFPLANP